MLLGYARSHPAVPLSSDFFQMGRLKICDATLDMTGREHKNGRSCVRPSLSLITFETNMYLSVLPIASIARLPNILRYPHPMAESILVWYARTQTNGGGQGPEQHSGVFA